MGLLIDAAEFYKIEASPSGVVQHSRHGTGDVKGLPKSLPAGCGARLPTSWKPAQEHFFGKGKEQSVSSEVS